MKLVLEINQQAIKDPTRRLATVGLLVTPPIDEGFWLYRVAVSGKQAIVGFPKFGLIGIGFQVEEDWNTNLPSNCDAGEIYEHIAHNATAAGDTPTREDCIEAIKLIREAANQAQ